MYGSAAFFVVDLVHTSRYTQAGIHKQVYTSRYTQAGIHKGILARGILAGCNFGGLGKFGPCVIGRGMALDAKTST